MIGVCSKSVLEGVILALLNKNRQNLILILIRKYDFNPCKYKLFLF
jgi:hypothetical protein